MEQIYEEPRLSFKVGKSDIKNAVDAAIGLGVCLTALILTWHRLYYGVDFTDESFYIALSYRFALGDIPINNEQNITQFAGVLLSPIIRLFIRTQGNTDGIVIFSRHLHFFFTILVGSSVFIAARPIIGSASALLVLLISVVFIPFNIHGLSYNTMGCGFLTIGCFLGIRGQTHTKHTPWPYFFSGLAHGLATFVYPTLLVAVLIYAVLILRDRDAQLRGRMAYVLGGLITALLPLTLVMRAGLDSLGPMLEYVTSVGAQGGGWEKFIDVVLNFWLNAPLTKALVIAMAVLAFWHRFKPNWLRLVLPFLPCLFLLYLFRANGTASLYFVIAVSLLGPFVYPFVSKDNFAKCLFKLIWYPSLVGGFVTAWSSSNGAINGAIGMFPAALVSTLLIIRALQLMATPTKFGRITQNVMMMLTPAFVILPLLVGQYIDVYGESVASTSSLTEQVINGPYRGIKTTVAKNNFIDGFSRDLKLLSRPDDTVLFIYDFPAGYLFSNLRPATNSVWLSALGGWGPVNRTPTVEYYRRKGIKPALIFMLKPKDFQGGVDVLADFIGGDSYFKIFNGINYDVYRLRQMGKSGAAPISIRLK